MCPSLHCVWYQYRVRRDSAQRLGRIQARVDKGHRDLGLVARPNPKDNRDNRKGRRVIYLHHCEKSVGARSSTMSSFGLNAPAGVIPLRGGARQPFHCALSLSPSFCAERRDGSSTTTFNYGGLY